MPAQAERQVGAGGGVAEGGRDADGQDGGVVREGRARGVVVHQADGGAAEGGGAVLEGECGGEDGGEGGDGGEVQDAAGEDGGLVGGREAGRGGGGGRGVGEDVVGRGGEDLLRRRGVRVCGGEEEEEEGMGMHNGEKRVDSKRVRRERGRTTKRSLKLLDSQ